MTFNNMSPERRYIERYSIEHRKSFAQFFTPYHVADVMAEWILQKSSIQTILEPAFGLGIFSRILKYKKPSLKIQGIEIDNCIYSAALDICDSDIQILNRDYLDTDFECKFDGIIANPPYLKFHEYNNLQYIGRINRLYKYNLNGFTNIYALFLLKSINELSEGGRCAYIIPSEFLNADYGRHVKEALLQSGTLRYIITFNSNESIFDDALTTSCIILCEKGAVRENVHFVSLDASSDIESILDIISGRGVYNNVRTYNVDELDPSIKWKNYLSENNTSLSVKSFVPFRLFAKVKRGIATGANSFFEFNIEKALKYNISINSLRPCICHCTDIKGVYFDDAKHKQLAQQNKKVYILDAVNCNDSIIDEYIKLGEQQGINKRFLTSKRNPWYSIEHRTPPPIWVSVFNRTGLRFIRNISKAVNLTTFHCIYTTEIVSDDLLFAYLVTDIAKSLFNSNSREYGNGLQKFEPNDLNNSLMLDLRLLPTSTINDILRIYQKLVDSDDPKYIQELNNVFEEYISMA